MQTFEKKIARIKKMYYFLSFGNFCMKTRATPFLIILREIKIIDWIKIKLGIIHENEIEEKKKTF